MKTLILILCCLSFIDLSAQNWYTLDVSNYFGSCNCSFTSNPDYPTKRFKINPYTNEVWMAKGAVMSVIRTNGILDTFQSQNMNIPFDTYPFLDFAFTDEAVYVARSYRGYYEYKNNVWTNYLSSCQTNTISEDKDTLFLTSIENLNYKIINDNESQVIENAFARKLISKNGNLWGNVGSSSLSKYSGTAFQYYHPDTSILLSNKSYDFKFSPNNDSFYVAGNLGISVALGNKFIDSICPFSSSNMPSNPSIIEFEIDKNENIWALFGNKLDSLTSIGFYNSSNRTWEQYYDRLNSPIDFSQKLTIELDTLGNLWVAERKKLHILENTEVLSWLSLKESTYDFEINSYPNPFENQLIVSINSNSEIKTIQLIDLKGKEIKTEYTFENNKILINTTDFDKGIYFFKINEFSEMIRVVKI